MKRRAAVTLTVRITVCWPGFTRELRGYYYLLRCAASIPTQPTLCAVLPASCNARDSWVTADTEGRSEDPPQFKYEFSVTFAKLCLKGKAAKLTKNKNPHKS